MADHITVCVCTYRRNLMLARLLQDLALQRTDGLFTFSAVVVDNDAEGPARAEVERLRSELPSLEILYGIETEKSIPAARNHALRLARGQYIAIIDDDEFPPPDWLATLYEGIKTFGVDGALGPVLPFFESPPPTWLIKSGLLDLPRRRTGTLLQWNQTCSGNVLLKKQVFDRDGLRFDVAYRTGGSDQAFFKQAMGANFRFITVDEAPVYEIVPPERWSKNYFVRRALVNGFNAQKYIAAERSRLRSGTAMVKSALSAGVYAVAFPVCFCLGTRVWMKCLEGGTYHLSRLAAFLGIELRKKRDF
jgi:glycosyltransferase involved in cell wall biosynthesis